MDAVHVSELPPELLRRLSLTRKLLLSLEILAIYCRVRVHLLRDEFPNALAALRDAGREAGSPPESPVTYMRAARLARAVQRTLGLVPADARCLMQSLVLTALLARRGIDTKLLIGVQPGEEFKSHAWVEYCGRALLPDSRGSYHVLAQL
jgi:hypothetical protein